MAFPTVQTADTKNGTVTSNSTSWTLTYPTNLASGDLIIALVATDGTPSATFPANWITGSQNGVAVHLHLAKKISLGTETGNFTVTMGASEQGSWRVFRITGWGGAIGTTFNGTATDDDVTKESANNTTNTPDPSFCDPDDWDVEDTLWIAACAVDTSRTISVYPLADLNTADVSGGASGATLGVCMANSAVSSLDPGTFTISNSDEWAAATIAIRPAAAANIVAKSVIVSQAVNHASTY